MDTPDDIFVVSDYVRSLFSWVVFCFICQITNIFGVVTNIINIICFAKQGYQDSVNISLTGLAVSDIGSLITMIWTCFFLTPAVLEADLPFDPKDVLYITSGMAHISFTRVSSCITAMITLERCLCITAPLKVKSMMTTKRTTGITVGIFIVFFWSTAPVWAVNKLAVRWDPSRNASLVGIVSTSNRENVEKVSFIVNNFSIPVGTFIIIVVCTAVLSFQLKRAAKWRHLTTSSTQVDRVSSRNQKAAKMVVMISTLFIVCFFPVICVLLGMAFIPGVSFDGKYFNVSLMVAGIGYILESFNSSMNIFIYYHMSSKYRECFGLIFFKTK